MLKIDMLTFEDEHFIMKTCGTATDSLPENC